MAQIDGKQFSTTGGDTAEALTKVMVLHPIACSLAFIAFVLAVSYSFCGSLVVSLMSAFTWLITLIAMACDFAAFRIIKNNVNSDGTGNHAYYSVGMWTIVTAMVCLFIATFLVEYADGGVASLARRRSWERSAY